MNDSLFAMLILIGGMVYMSWKRSLFPEMWLEVAKSISHVSLSLAECVAPSAIMMISSGLCSVSRAVAVSGLGGLLAALLVKGLLGLCVFVLVNPLFFIQGAWPSNPSPVA